MDGKFSPKRIFSLSYMSERLTRNVPRFPTVNMSVGTLTRCLKSNGSRSVIINVMSDT